ncbi:Hsp20/alpha crystallin family protein [Halorhabdus sp. CBA1104]|uniref:Hsp20/alpha crystallin family protein n=1 Tax=Halorhabdus sp. CBA1104 TaxID=1380432 RepID=UPI0012B1CF05|nr:Hsp20 family protein [Halorhabdus sp. CBA1104]QGN07517.1 Hsp20/alpha crystallin family protein [Halorhabdus sp. CBA1104]
MRDLRKFTESIGENVLENVGRAVGRAQEHTPLPVDLLESEDAYLAVFDAPGAVGSDVQVRLEDRRVEVRIDRFRDPREHFEMRFPGRGLTLDGHVTLPVEASVDGDAASATLQENGTLHVHVPKREGGTAVDVEAEHEAGDGDTDETVGSEQAAHDDGRTDGE